MSTVFYRPADKAEALSLLSKYGSSLMVVNGGTDAVLSLVEKKAAPEAIMQISDLPGFHDIWEGDGYLHIAGGVTFREMMDNPQVSRFKGLVDALKHLASPAIRIVGTAAGNICTAAPAADCAAMLYGLGAEVVLESAKGSRIVALSDFYNTEKSYSTVKESDELLTEIRIPLLKDGEGTGYCRLSRRKAQDIAKVIIGVRLSIADGRIASCQIALGALNATLVHATEAESKVVGMKIEDAISYAESTFPPEAKLHKSYFTEYKKQVVPAAVGKAFREAVINAGGSLK